MTKQKLVRDRIPEIMKEAGITPITELLNPQERLSWLLLKLQEETAELHAKPSIEECADVWEVLKAICFELGCSEGHLFDTAIDKVRRNGAFSSGVLLNI